MFGFLKIFYQCSCYMHSDEEFKYVYCILLYSQQIENKKDLITALSFLLHYNHIYASNICHSDTLHPILNIFSFKTVNNKQWQCKFTNDFEFLSRYKHFMLKFNYFTKAI